MRPATFLIITAATFAAAACPAAAAAPAELNLTNLGRTPAAGAAGAEIASYHAPTKQMFVTNAATNAIDVFDITNPASPVAKPSIALAPYGGGPNSVATSKTCGGLVAVAQEADVRTDPGKVLFFKPNGMFLRSVTVGALPDMLTFTPNGQTLLVANEGEPADDGSVDPEGSVSVIDELRGCQQAPRVRTADFRGGFPKIGPIRIFGPDTDFARNVEPEYVSTDKTGQVAYVSLQEANAIATLDIRSATVRSVKSLGFQDHGKVPLDASDRDGVNIRTYDNVFGMFQPDAIATYSVQGRTYVATANEGDARDYPYFAEETRVNGISSLLDPVAFPPGSVTSNGLGRLTVTRTLGQNSAGRYERLYAFGSRSMSILDAGADMVSDTGDQMERYIAANDAATFNSNHGLALTPDDRSDNKGPEPEGLAVGNIDGRAYAFVGMERQGGIFAYDLRAKPGKAEFAGYINTRPADRGPEGVAFISAEESPNGRPLVLVTNEVTGTVNIIQATRK